MKEEETGKMQEGEMRKDKKKGESWKEEGKERKREKS